MLLLIDGDKHLLQWVCSCVTQIRIAIIRIFTFAIGIGLVVNRTVILFTAVSIDLFIIHCMKLCDNGCVFSVLSRSDDALAAIIEVINVVGAVIRCCFELSHKVPAFLPSRSRAWGHNKGRCL